MLCCVWCPRMLQVRRHQPFLLDMWRALSGVTSGIWETVHMEEEFDPPRGGPRAIERDPLVSDWGIIGPRTWSYAVAWCCARVLFLQQCKHKKPSDKAQPGRAEE